MKRPLTRKQRSRLGLCLMLLLSSAIIGGGLLAAVWMDKLVPSFTNEIIRLADDDTATPLFSWNDNTNLSIYPWSQFNAAKSRPINEREMEILREGTADSYIYSILGEKQNRVDDTLLRQFVVGDEASDSERYMFLKDAVITLTDGRRYMMNSAAAESTGTVAYLHFKDIDAEPATEEEFNAAYQQVEEYLKEFYQAYILFYEHTEMNKIVPVDKEVVAFFEKMLYTLQVWQAIAAEYNQSLCSDVLGFAMDKGFSEPELLSADSELLLIYTLDYNIRMILFLEPKNMDFVGYSIQVE